MYLVHLPVDDHIHANVLTLTVEEHNQLPEHIHYGWSFAVLSSTCLHLLWIHSPNTKALCDSVTMNNNLTR